MAKIFQRTSITVNGQTYHSVDEMPSDVRQQYEQIMSRVRADTNQNGIPDIFEGKPKDGVTVAAVRTSVEGFLGDPPSTAAGVTPVSQELRERAMARAANKMTLTARSESRSGAGSSSGVGIYLTWPTLVALLATAAVLGAAVAWYFKSGHLN